MRGWIKIVTGTAAVVATSSLLHAGPEEMEPLLDYYCLECHDSASAKGNIDLEAALARPLGEEAELWERAFRQLRSHLMPPIGKDRPTEEEYTELCGTLLGMLDAHAAEYPNPGRTDSLRRLNRSEYRNAIRDLLALEIEVETLLPADQESHGFDNVTLGDLSPALLDRYIGAAQKISRIALGRTGQSPGGRTVRLRPDVTQEHHVEGLPLGTRGGTLIRHDFPRSGEYDIRINLMRDRNEKVEGLVGTHELQILLDDEIAASFKVRPPDNKKDHTMVDAHLAARIQARAGLRELGVTFVKPPADLIGHLRQPYESAFNYHRHPRRSPAIYQVSITGPVGPGEAGSTASRRRIFGDTPGRDEPAARVILQRLMRRACRGRVAESDLDRVVEFFREGAKKEGFEAGIEAALSAILVSPGFLIRVEREPEDAMPGTPYRLVDHELASRLSFFLWSSIPDDQLLEAAAAGELRTPDGMTGQARRMLAHPNSRSLVGNFANQWLYLRNLDSITPDARLFPDFDDNLRQAMRRETEMLFESVMREDRSVIDLLRSGHTFLNERLAKHYGIPHIYGERMRRVQLDAREPRGGILRHGSILTVTSYANRTSPVLRGHWVLENILGTPPPPPPPDVPALEDARIDASLPVRERLAAHRENKACAHCHNPMDPVGFAFENYDAIGQWRTREGEAHVNSEGSLPDGTRFDDIAGLEEALLKDPDLFARSVTEKLLTFGLGRGIGPSDAPMIREIVRKAALDDYRFSAIILRIVESDLFTMRMTDD
ncbi:MAG: DUF1592 domain-containing protein [Planctomycetota bacterium]|jgi:hypothetical protein